MACELEMSPVELRFWIHSWALVYNVWADLRVTIIWWEIFSAASLFIEFVCLFSLAVQMRSLCWLRGAAASAITLWMRLHLEIYDSAFKCVWKEQVLYKSCFPLRYFRPTSCRCIDSALASPFSVGLISGHWLMTSSSPSNWRHTRTRARPLTNVWPTTISVWIFQLMICNKPHCFSE